MKKNALGKGLSALIPDSYINSEAMVKKNEALNSKGLAENTILEIKIAAIRGNPDQPRRLFQEAAMEDLVSSIKEKGIIQPIIVSKNKDGEHYDLICGERRLLAAEKAGLVQVPAVVKDATSDDFLELALIENIQREDLNAVEEAEAYMKLFERGLAHEEIAKKVGKDRTTVVNGMRILSLPQEVLALVIDNQISEGHARAILALPTAEYQRRFAKRIIEEKLSVRKVEEIIKRKGYRKRPAKQLRKMDAQILDLERKLEDTLGSKVRLFAGKSKGRIEIKYFSLDELDRILAVLGIKTD
ncbi:MAG: ParB/RepB/Spo0J family partition protein [Candidatus Omnitrophica bacterium]|nr:ParB/RepB/Spo0J family partition protein [Candidatus Omnitrophota bacterium]